MPGSAGIQEGGCAGVPGSEEIRGEDRAASRRSRGSEKKGAVQERIGDGAVRRVPGSEAIWGWGGAGVRGDPGRGRAWGLESEGSREGAAGVRVCPEGSGQAGPRR